MDKEGKMRKIKVGPKKAGLKKVKEKPKKEEIREVKNFQTTDINLVYKLNKMGFRVKTTLSPGGQRTEKTYVFHEDEETIKEALKNG